MPHIAIIIVGEAHYDPAPKNLIYQEVVKLQTATIPVIYCDESSTDKKLEDELHLRKIQVEFYNVYTAKPQIRKHLIKDTEHKRSYFSLDLKKALANEVKMIRQDLNATVTAAAAEMLITHLHDAEKVRLLEYIQQNKIKFLGIDLPYAERKKMLDIFSASDVAGNVNDAIAEYEPARIKIMKKTIIDHACSALAETGGVIVVSVGDIHAKRLAVHLSNSLQQLQGDMTYKISTISMLSNYDFESIDYRRDVTSEVEELVDSAKILAQYRSIDFQLIRAHETERGEFQSSEVSAMFSVAVKSYNTAIIKPVPYVVQASRSTTLAPTASRALPAIVKPLLAEQSAVHKTVHGSRLTTLPLYDAAAKQSISNTAETTLYDGYSSSFIAISTGLAVLLLVIILKLNRLNNALLPQRQSSVMKLD